MKNIGIYCDDSVIGKLFGKELEKSLSSTDLHFHYIQDTGSTLIGNMDMTILLQYHKPIEAVKSEVSYVYPKAHLRIVKTPEVEFPVLVRELYELGHTTKPLL